MAKKRSKNSIHKYNMGSYVSYSQQPTFDQQKPSSGGNVSSILSSAGSMAAAGATVGGPWGAAIGGVIGLGAGLFGASKQRDQYKAALSKYNSDIHTNYTEEYNQMGDLTNDNPYGTYQLGGDILNNKINIEAGEMQVDPETGKILRKFKGINPETGGKYEPHNKKGSDTKNNLVSAEEGTFIITKAKSKEYEKALDNNDKLHQNSIMHNIRNKKRQSLKFRDGGIVRKNSIDFKAGYTNNINPNLNTTGISPVSTTLNTPDLDMGTSSPKINLNSLGNIGMGLLSAMPAITNITQGLSTPTQLSSFRQPANTYRREALANMPRDINYNPLFNRIYRDRNAASGMIDNTTSSSAIGRANKQNLYANTTNAIQDAYFQGENLNNNIRAQRGGMYDRMGEADRASTFNTANMNNSIALNNLQIREGRRQQFNHGLSQIGQLTQNRVQNRQLRERDLLTMGIIGGMNPAALPLFESLNIGR